MVIDCRKCKGKVSASLALVAVAIVITGCSTRTYHVKRYTWAPTGSVAAAPEKNAPNTAVATAEPARLREVGVKCLKEMNDTYVPNLYGGGVAIKETLYKDCVERHGYVKTSTEVFTVTGERESLDERGPRYRIPSVPCGQNQTCLLR